jgi:hypothetical protein
VRSPPLKNASSNWGTSRSCLTRSDGEKSNTEKNNTSLRTVACVQESGSEKSPVKKLIFELGDFSFVPPLEAGQAHSK